MPPESISLEALDRAREGLLHVTSWSGGVRKVLTLQNSNRMRSQTETFPAFLVGSGLALLFSLLK